MPPGLDAFDGLHKSILTLAAFVTFVIKREPCTRLVLQ